METTINYKGYSVACYGGSKGLQEDDNIIMAWYDKGSDSDYEGDIENWNYKTEKPFKNWTDAVHYLVDLERFDDIMQLEAC